MTRRRGALLGLCLLLSAGVALACFTVFGLRMGDSVRYLSLAHNLAAGNGYSSAAEPPYWPEVFRAPLYPFFLSAVFRLGLSTTSIPVVQYALYLVGSVVIWKAAITAHGERAAADLLVAILSVHAPLIRWSVQVATEALALPLFCGTALLLLRHLQRPTWTNSAALGFITGALFLLRTDYVLLLVGVPCASALHQRGARLVRFPLVVAACAMSLAGPWMARNAVSVPGAFKPLGVGGGMAVWVRGVELTVADLNAREAVVQRDARIRTLHDTANPPLLEAADSAMLAEGLRTVWRFRGRACIDAIWKLVFRNWVEHSDSRVPALAGVLAFIWSSSLLGAAYVGGWLLLRRGPTRPLLWIVLPVAAIHAFLITEARYTAPLRPIVLLFSAYGMMFMGRQAHDVVRALRDRQ